MSTGRNSRISAGKAVEAWRRGAILIDVRSPNGRARNGELAGTVVVAKPDVVDFVTQRLGKPGAELVLFCGSVSGTTPLLEALAEAGHLGAAEVDGGFASLVATGAFSVSEPLLT